MSLRNRKITDREFRTNRPYEDTITTKTTLYLLVRWCDFFRKYHGRNMKGEEKTDIFVRRNNYGSCCSDVTSVSEGRELCGSEGDEVGVSLVESPDDIDF